MLGGTYSTGTVSVTNGSATVTGIDVLWNDVLEGDELWPTGQGPMIIGADVVHPFSTITLMKPWPGTTAVGVTYVIVKTSWKRHDVTELQKLWRTLAAELEATGNFIFVEGDVPDPEMGDNGQWALKTNAVPWKVWYKEFNVWVYQGFATGGGDMVAANNLSEIPNDAAARSNIGAVAKIGDTMTGPLMFAGHNKFQFNVNGGGAFYDTDTAANRFFLGTNGTGDYFRLYGAGTATNIIAVDGTNGTITLTPPLPIGSGGTGSISPSGAAAALGVLPLTGGTMTGYIAIQSAASAIIILDPQDAAQQALIQFSQTGAAKWLVGKQVDDSFLIYSPSGGTVFGAPYSGSHCSFYRDVYLPADPTQPQHAANKQYVDAAATGYATKAAVQAATIDAAKTYLRTAGYAAAADGGGALYKKVGSSPAHNGKIQSLDGAWWEIAEASPDVRMFGAKFDNATDDLTAWNDAIGWANAKGGNVTVRSTGGTSLISGTVAAITTNDVWIVGDKSAGIRCGSNTTTFKWGTLAIPIDGGGIDGLDFTCTGTPTGAQLCIEVVWASRLTFSRIAVVDIACFLSLGTDAARPASQISVFELTGWCINVVAPFIEWRYGNGFRLSRIDVLVTTQGSVGRSFLSVTTASVDTCQMQYMLVQQFWAGIFLQAQAGAVIQNFTMSDSFFDGITGYGCFFVVSAPTGKIINFRGSNCWFTGGGSGASWGERNLYCTNQSNPANGLVEDVGFSNSVFMVAQMQNIYLASNCRRMNFDGCRTLGPNGSAGGVPSVHIEAGVQDIQFRGGFYNHDAAFMGIPARGAYAFGIDANADRYSIIGVEASGTAASFNVGTNSTGSKRRRISECANPDYIGVKTGTGNYTLPASGGTFTNLSPFTVEVYLWAGTVSVIAKNGLGISTQTPMMLRLDPGDTYSVTYTVAPGFNYVIVR